MNPDRAVATTGGSFIFPGEREAFPSADFGEDDNFEVREHPIVEVDSDRRITVDKLAHNYCPSPLSISPMMALNSVAVA